MIRVTIKQAATKQKIYSAAELARAVGVKEAVAGRWWKWETEADPMPTLESLQKIITAFGCDLGDLVKVTPDKKKRRGNGNG